MNHTNTTTFTRPRWATMSVAERVAAIRKGIALGQSPRELADIYGTTRNAILGRGYRSGLKFPAAPTVPVSSRQVFDCLPPVSEDNWLPHRSPVMLLCRNDTQCSWPVGHDSSRQCCGDTVHAKSFCATHYAKAYRPATETLAPVSDRPFVMSINRHDRRALVHGGKAQHYEAEF